ncbi:MAG: 2-oxo acid dehydrogenase subunit E2 [Rhodoferax sp.]|nr:2-oxo acid dehydrogenase subunit E2 [Betaproteobacteria bacterium]NCN96730.1 2-oxo acid dehydrogenase subunit E2 [Rhodoferax sp.]PIZ22596.1 MAG: branched-chain alpha-keto acid dehydrogenase subunit E2 [Comamonadaceae bacterium CG_4_10_14_0_8_um_filter_57_29]PJC16101.1 MAG: branched-chain alpha-keto acid dehydrogenase subunit E2 [Comamonadaceae bacterium CG_4_9_14_0_8_um_filter_57_21]NCP80767.1 2-oxo acid dehydrogenase subunit E2 [Rhodoferax sp.]
MAIQTIKMPDIGEGIAEVELVAWHIKVGDVVAEDQILADVMTDKATVEIPSHVAGTVVSLNAAVGEVVAVGTEIIHIEVSNDALALVDKAQAAIKDEAIKEEVTKAVAAPAPALPSKATRSPQTTATVKMSALSEHHHPIAAPAVRRRAWELGVDLNLVSATGPAGRITLADLERYGATSNADQLANREAATPDQRYAQQSAEEVIPVIGLRRKIAQKMQEAKRHIPHFTYVEEIDVTELEELRARLNAQFAATRGRLTLLPFLMRAIVLAVRDHPEVNARFDDEANQLTRFAAVHLGLATQTAGGLMVPVIRHAESLDLWASAAAVLRVSEAARGAKAARDELSGSTITLTSLGALGGIVSTPVINHPEVAIVGTNRMVERPMMKNGQVVARKMMNLSSSFDHRVVDGMNAAEFIQQIRGYLECPGTLLV